MSTNKKTVAITGATGGLGKLLAKDLASFGTDLVFLDRDIQKSKNLANEILKEYPNTKIDFVTVDLVDLDSVKSVAKDLKDISFDTIVLNAGVFNVKLEKTKTGYNNIFQTNFLSQYFLIRELLKTNSNLKKIVAVGSIAQSWSKVDLSDIDYSHKKSKMKIYGNSKKFLMFSLAKLMQKYPNTTLSIAHPGITSTNMTSSFNKSINWLVKAGMKIVFQSPQKAVKNIFKAVFEDCDHLEWIGPKIFDIWGKPTKKKIKKTSISEIEQIDNIANKIYQDLAK